MIASLADAWQWYTSVRGTALAMRALGKRHWDNLPWEGELGRDDRLRDLTKRDVLGWTEAVLSDLDDLCVLLLFSVFEAIVRERARADVADELKLTPLRHLALRYAINSLNEALEYGSFYRVLEAYKGLDADLIEQVNQVRRYRNWVAHGRRGGPPEYIDPGSAYDRLQRFLDQML